VVIARSVIEFCWTLRVSKPEAWSITFDGQANRFSALVLSLKAGADFNN